MANQFPTAVNNYVTGASSATLVSAGHAAAHNAYEAKIGTGASTPTNNTVLRGNGTGTSVWAQVGLTTDVTGTLPVANGGSGAATLTGILKGNGTSAFTAVTAPSGTIVGHTDTQTLTNKSIDGDDNTLTDIPAANLKIASQATGDLLYASSASAWARLAIGAATTFLTGGATPSFSFAFSQYKVGSTTYDTATTGSLAVTGVGFTGKILILVGVFASGTESQFSIGVATSSSARWSISQDDRSAHKTFSDASKVGIIWDAADGATNSQLDFTTWDADGFTLTKTKNGSPTGTATLLYLVLG